MNTKFKELSFFSKVITIHFFLNYSFLKQIPQLAEIVFQLVYETVLSALLIPYSILFYRSSCLCFTDFSKSSDLFLKLLLHATIKK